MNNSTDAAFFRARALSAPFTIFNNGTGFMEARFGNGSWAGPTAGWTEGDEWAYTFDVLHDFPGLIAAKGGNASFVQFLDEHFDGGHNDHTNEVRCISTLDLCRHLIHHARSASLPTISRTCIRLLGPHPSLKRASGRSHRQTITTQWMDSLGHVPHSRNLRQPLIHIFI